MSDSCNVNKDRTDFQHSNSLIAKKLLKLGASNHYSAATIEVTSRCNAFCNYCYIDSSNASDLSREQIFQILDKLSGAGILMVSFTGGEPFLHKDFIDILQYAIDKNFWKLSIITNGSCINEHHLRLITENATIFSAVQFSAFSHIPSVHDSYTGIPGSHQKLINCAKQLSEGNVPVKIAINITESNFRTFEDSVTFFKKAGFNVTWSLHKIVADCTSSGAREQIRRETTVPFYREFISMFNEDRIKIMRKRYIRLSERISADKISLCKGLFFSFYIDSKGNIHPCVSFRNMIIGSIFDKRPLHEMFSNSNDLQKLKTMKLSDIPKCGNCKYNNVCNFCVGMNHSETGSVETPCEQHCNYTYSLASHFDLENG